MERTDTLRMKKIDRKTTEIDRAQGNKQDV